MSLPISPGCPWWGRTARCVCRLPRGRRGCVRHLVVVLDGVTGPGPQGGDVTTLHTAPPSEHMQRHGRGAVGRLYGSCRSWLATGRTPTPTRREVPLDVLVAGAAASED